MGPPLRKFHGLQSKTAILHLHTLLHTHTYTLDQHYYNIGVKDVGQADKKINHQKA